MFGIKKETVKIVNESGDTDVYELSPLTGEYLELFFEVAKGMKTSDESEESVDFDEGTIKKLHTLVFESLKLSYPEQDVQTLELFTSQNLFSFVEAVVKVNTPKVK